MADEIVPQVARARGRPRKEGVDPEVAAAICERLMLAMPLSLAAEAVGVPRITAQHWIARYPEFAEQVTRARATGAEMLTRWALRGGPGSSNAMSLLQRRYWKHYGKREEKNADRPDIKIVVVGGLPQE